VLPLQQLNELLSKKINAMKNVIGLLFVFMISINVYGQRDIKHDLIVSDTMEYLVGEFPDDFGWLLLTMTVSSTSHHEKPLENTFYMLFLVDSTTVVLQSVSRTKDAELFAKYNPATEADSNMCVTIENLTTGKKKKEVAKKANEFADYVYFELRKKTVSAVSIRVEGNGRYCCKSF
jgi:hypothetical protein